MQTTHTQANTVIWADIHTARKGYKHTYIRAYRNKYRQTGRTDGRASIQKYIRTNNQPGKHTYIQTYTQTYRQANIQAGNNHGRQAAKMTRQGIRQAGIHTGQPGINTYIQTGEYGRTDTKPAGTTNIHTYTYVHTYMHTCRAEQGRTYLHT